MKGAVTELAERYFNYLSRSFPVMCASDEFHFMPRAEKAGLYYNKIDNFDADAVNECIFILKEFQSDFSGISGNKDRIARHDDNLEAFIDLELLKASVAGILIELETKRSWRNNPLLYLKVAFIGLDHASSKPASGQEELTRRVLDRLGAIPRLLKQAARNINQVPAPYRQASLNMIVDCRNYLLEIKKSLSHDKYRDFNEYLDNTWSALDGFEAYLRSIPLVHDGHADIKDIEATLRGHFMIVRSLAEIFQIGMEEWQKNLRQLKRIQAKIDSQKSWKELYDSYCPPDIERMDTISLYRQEFEQLYRFFREHGFQDFNFNTSLEICETPVYLRSVRGAASFSAAFSTDRREKDFFFITTQMPKMMSKNTARLLRKRLYREYKFLTAHETFPGHHLLDSFRRQLKNPVRRQIESPLFYEGWAYYAESLLDSYEYVKSPIDHLVNARRSLWRAARCQIDAGLINGMLTREDAVGLLKEAGFTQDEANDQIDRFQLNPGYQLCYSLGRYEILKLKQNYGTLLGLERFHRRLLEGGELPFHLIAERFKNLAQE